MKAQLEKTRFDNIFRSVGQAADVLGYQCYVVGGFVRDFFLGKDNDDIDFVVVGSGLTIAEEVAKIYNTKADLYQNYGTAKVNANGIELEFVGARKEFYHRESRNPIVENGTLEDDLMRRDFTINDIAICVNSDNYGEVIDPNNGIDDLNNKIIRCVGSAYERFDEDPLRMLRAIRFAARFSFDVEENIYAAIKDAAPRIKIISQERICTELEKMMTCKNPAMAIRLLDETRLLDEVLKPLADLRGREVINGVSHKDVLKHTIQVLESVAKETENEWVRWAALLHDVGKGPTKKFENNQWSFTNHAEVGASMIPKIFKKMALPLDDRMQLVQKLVAHHMHPADLCGSEVTDSAIRRLMFNLGDHIDDLMILCNADITSSNAMKVKAFQDNYTYLLKRMVEVEESDHIRNFQPPIDGNEIMKMFNLTPCRTVGILKDAVKDAILDGKIKNTYEEAKQFVIDLYATL